MTYRFGWWDYDDAADPAMVNRHTHERRKSG
jgi:hypothetical protein